MKKPFFFTNLCIKSSKCLAFIILFIFSTYLSKAQLKVDFNASTTTGCAPLIVKFNDLSTGNASKWLWDLGNGTTSILQNPSVAYFEPGTYSVKLIIRNTSGIDSITKVQYITVYSSPIINFIGSPLSGCFPLTTKFTDLSFAGSGTIEKWEWDFGDGNFSGSQNSNHIYTAVGNYNVSLRTTNTFGCITTKTAPSYIHINSGVKAAFTNSTSSTCSAPATINFINNSIGIDSLTYQWNFGDGSTSILANPSHTYNSPGSFTVTLIVTNSTGCTDTLKKLNLITIGNTKANFTLTAPVCLGVPFTVKNTSVPSPESSFWDFGDGTFSDSINPSKAYAKEGIYIIKLVNNLGACKDSVRKSVQVMAIPTVDFSALSTTSCKTPFTVNFKNSSIGGATYSWDFGDGKTSNIENASHTYLTEGSYTVKLAVTNASGCKDSIIKSNFIKIKAPVVTLNNLPQKGCAPLEHTFSAQVNSIDLVTGYQWDFGDGTSSKDISPTHVYNTPGNYTVTLTYTTAGGCTNSVKVVNGILVGSKPQPGFTADPLDACADKNINFTDNTIGKPNEWLWLFGDGSSSAAQNPVHQYNDTGYFSVTLIAIDNGCADTLILPNKIHINPPVARFTSSKTCAQPGYINFIDLSIGADSWHWDFGDGSTSSEKDPIHEFATSGVYTVSLTVTNQLTGCSKTKTDPVKVVKEKAEFISSDASICKNAPVKFTAANSIPGDISLYTWKFGDNISISDPGNSISHSYSKASSYNVTLIIKDINGCIDSITKPLAVKVDGPTAFFRSTIPGICLNNEVSFFDSSFTDGTHDIRQWKFNWGDGNSQDFSAPPFNHTYATAANYSVSLKVTDSKGCTDSISKPNIIIVSKPTAVFSGDTLSCTTKPVSFINSSTGPQLNYTWDFGDGVASVQQNPSHLYNTEGAYTVNLTVNDMYGCSNTVSKTNYVKIANPVANFSLSDSVGTCPPLVVNFTNTSANYTKWSWDFGDGTSSTLLNPSHFYSSVGTFNVVLTITGPSGCTSQKTKQIKVAGPSGSFSYANLTGCTPVQTSFKAHTAKGVSFVWDFNDGTTIPTADSVISHNYTAQGKFLPKMILVDASGCKVPIPGKDTIQTFGVIALFKHTGALVCDSGTVQFTNTSITNDVITSYLWDFGNSKKSAQQNPLHNYNQTGIYNSSLSVITQRGCKDTIRNPTPVKVSKSPEISIGGIAGACMPAVINFSGVISKPDTSAISWKWDFANGNASTKQHPDGQNYSSAGKFIVKAIATNSSGCDATTIKNIEIYPLPSLSTKDAVLCVGSSARLQVSGAKMYSWSPATYLSCTNCATPVSKADTAIKYEVTGISDKGCISKDSIKVTVKFPFKLSISKSDTLCFGRSIQLNASGTETYTWTPSKGLNDPSIASPEASPTTSTTYRVIGSDSKGCFKDTGYIPISVFPFPVVNAGTDKTINVGQQIEIIPQLSPDVTNVLWTPSKGIVSNNNPGITVKPTESIEYTIDVKNAGGCKARDKISVFVLCNNANVFVPNTFSPNGDGSNDIFYPRGSGVFRIKNFRIFNRWGEIVFERSGFNANDASSGWDGTYKGKKLPPDVFVYMLEVVCDNNTSLVFKGDIALIK